VKFGVLACEKMQRRSSENAADRAACGDRGPIGLRAVSENVRPGVTVQVLASMSVCHASVIANGTVTYVARTCVGGFSFDCPPHSD